MTEIHHNRPVRLLSARILSSENRKKIAASGMILYEHEFVRTKAMEPENVAEIVSKYSVPAVFTSQYAIQAIAQATELFPECLQNLDCFCIEGKSSTYAHESGFHLVGTAKDSFQLSHKIIESQIPELVLYTTKLRLDTLQEILHLAGVKLYIEEVYEKSVDSKTINDFDSVIFFSPSQIDSFFLQNNLKPETPVFAIGDTTAKHLNKYGHQKIIIAPETSEDCIINQIIEHYTHEQ